MMLMMMPGLVGIITLMGTAFQVKLVRDNHHAGVLVSASLKDRLLLKHY